MGGGGGGGGGRDVRIKAMRTPASPKAAAEDKKTLSREGAL